MTTTQTSQGHYHDPQGKYDYCLDPRCPRSVRAMVLAYIERNRFQSRSVIAHALDLDVRDVSRALLELERTEPGVTVCGGIIGYIGRIS